MEEFCDQEYQLKQIFFNRYFYYIKPNLIYKLYIFYKFLIPAYEFQIFKRTS